MGRDFVREVFYQTEFLWREKNTTADQRNAIVVKTVSNMVKAVDDHGQPVFKPEELLDSSQIKSLFYSFTHSEKKRKTPRPLVKKDPTKKGEIPKCSICNTVFSVQRSLREHIEVVHEGKKPFDCTLCEKKFSKKNNLNQHFERHHVESKKKVSDNARNYIKEIFKNIKLTGRKHRKEVAAETAIKMKEIMDEFDQPIFKPDEYLDAVQINTLLYSFTQVENKKLSRHQNKKK